MDKSVETQIYTYSELFAFCSEVFLRIGCNKSHSELATEVLLSADLRGVDSHGIARLAGYVRLWEAGRVNTNPNIRIIHKSKSTATVDGDAGLGLLVAPTSMEIAIDFASKVGSGWVSVQNSNHFGIAGYHAMMALKHDMIGIAMTNASPLVAPTFSVERLLGTNPIAMAIPCDKYPPFVADFATTTAANGKLEILQRKNATAPQGWIQDKSGNSSIDPGELKQGGALLPLGSDFEHGSHKGYCLGSMVDILSGVLSGANYGPWVPPFVSFIPVLPNLVGKGIGHFFGAMEIDGFRPASEFKSHMDHWISTFKNAAAVSDKTVLIPGEPEFESETKRRMHGIPLHPSVSKDLQDLAVKLRINANFGV